MGKLVTARQWVRERFAKGSRPRLEQVRTWVECFEVPGQIIGDVVYIDADAAASPPPKPEKLTAYDLLA